MLFSQCVIFTNFIFHEHFPGYDVRNDNWKHF